MKLCDLHTHSCYSDGSDSPKQIIELAASLGIAVALTDHNTTAGLDEFLAEANARGVTAIAGVELSTLYCDKELHLLGLFLPREHYADIEALVKDFKFLKEKSNADLLKRLAEEGYPIDYSEIRKRAPEGNVNRAHIAAELTRLGYVSSIKEAFSTLLSKERGLYTPPPRPDFFETVALLKKLGALPVLAHPLQELSEDELCELLPRAIEQGLIGIETLHSSFSPEKIAAAKEIAQKFGLCESGGSDYHGVNKPDVTLGDPHVPIELYEILSSRREVNFT